MQILCYSQGELKDESEDKDDYDDVSILSQRKVNKRHPQGQVEQGGEQV